MGANKEKFLIVLLEHLKKSFNCTLKTLKKIWMGFKRNINDVVSNLLSCEHFEEKRIFIILILDI